MWCIVGNECNVNVYIWCIVGHEYFHEWFDLEAGAALPHPRSLHALNIYSSLNFWKCLFLFANIFNHRKYSWHPHSTDSLYAPIFFVSQIWEIFLFPWIFLSSQSLLCSDIENSGGSNLHQKKSLKLFRNPPICQTLWYGTTLITISIYQSI